MSARRIPSRKKGHEDCVDATAFTVVQVSLSASLSGCTLATFTEDSVHLYDDGDPTSYASHGDAPPASPT